METERLESVRRLGGALWADGERATRALQETVGAVSLLGLDQDLSLEKMGAALYARAERDGSAINGAALNHPFYRLPAGERLILAALHLSHWSYARLGRVLGVPVGTVAARAWSARLHLAAGSGVPHPGGAGAAGPHCPEYDVLDPWTQRFLDEELPPARLHFLRLHLTACVPCREALGRCRRMYYAVEKMIPAGVSGAASADTARGLERVWDRTRAYARSSDARFSRSLRVFFRRPDAWMVMTALVALLLYLRQ